jgi:hypothetical protein
MVQPHDYTLRVMPYDDDLREDFDPSKPCKIHIFLLIVIIVLFLLYMIRR